MLSYFNLLLSSLRERIDQGFCYVCERPTQWHDHGARYRCTNCGHDPVHSRPE